jgi:uncharacterized protein (TIGR03435 family)
MKSIRTVTMSTMLASAVLWGQTPAAPLSFEVASARVAPPPAPAKDDYSAGYNAGVRAARAAVGLRIRGNHVSVTDNSLRDLIRLAYGVKEHQISGPAWMAQEKYEIEAITPAGANQDQVPEMLRTLLEQRFQLQLHRETREMAVNVLEPSKGGAKLTVAPAGRRGTSSARPGRVVATSVSLSVFAELLTRAEDRPVIDMTGIAGLFDFDLRYTPELDAAAADAGPSLATALTEQMGLRLERRKLPVEVLVIDRANKVPTEK